MCTARARRRPVFWRGVPAYMRWAQPRRHRRGFLAGPELSRQFISVSLSSGGFTVARNAWWMPGLHRAMALAVGYVRLAWTARSRASRCVPEDGEWVITPPTRSAPGDPLLQRRRGHDLPPSRWWLAVAYSFTIDRRVSSSQILAEQSCARVARCAAGTCVPSCCCPPIPVLCWAFAAAGAFMVSTRSRRHRVTLDLSQVVVSATCALDAPLGAGRTPNTLGGESRAWLFACATPR